MYCLCVNVYCHRVTTQLQLTNISYHVYSRMYLKVNKIPKCTISVDTLDLFFRRPDDDSIESKHVAFNVII